MTLRGMSTGYSYGDICTFSPTNLQNKGHCSDIEFPKINCVEACISVHKCVCRGSEAVMWEAIFLGNKS